MLYLHACEQTKRDFPKLISFLANRKLEADSFQNVSSDAQVSSTHGLYLLLGKIFKRCLKWLNKIY